MRWIAMVCAVAALVAACTIKPGQSSTGATDAGTSSCDNKNDCAACVTCAGQVACAQEVNACDQNAACSGIIQCINTCSDPTCKQDCLTNNPSGVTDYNTVANCVYCEECPHDCAGFRQCG